jgi:cytoskeletal protein CcmA (bactofilin family)
MGKVHGNVECSDRLDLRSEGSLTGDVSTHRISVEDGAVLKGSIQVKSSGDKAQHKNEQKHDAPKAAAASAGNA